MTKSKTARWFTGSKRESTKTGLKFVTPRIDVLLRPVVGKEASRLGVAPRSVFVPATLKHVTKASLFVSNRQAKQASVADFLGGERLSLEKLRERRQSGEIGYRTEAAKEQAGKQHVTRSIKSATRGPFTREAVGIKSTHNVHPPRYNAALGGPKAVKEILRRKIVDGEYIEDGKWHMTMDWLRAHNREELLELFRTRGASTPGEIGITISRSR